MSLSWKACLSCKYLIDLIINEQHCLRKEFYKLTTHRGWPKCKELMLFVLAIIEGFSHIMINNDLFWHCGENKNVFHVLLILSKAQFISRCMLFISFKRNCTFFLCLSHTPALLSAFIQVKPSARDKAIILLSLIHDAPKLKNIVQQKLKPLIYQKASPCFHSLESSLV